jgi:glycosyltransferase involved in cell wall biosynthesis
VAYDYAAPRLLIRSGENGWLAPFNEEGAFLAQTRVAAAGWQNEELRFAARQSAFDLGWERVIEQFEHELASVMPKTNVLM